jgi:hypothetical protein
MLYVCVCDSCGKQQLFLKIHILWDVMLCYIFRDILQCPNACIFRIKCHISEDASLQHHC